MKKLLTIAAAAATIASGAQAFSYNTSNHGNWAWNAGPSWITYVLSLIHI